MFEVPIEKKKIVRVSPVDAHRCLSKHLKGRFIQTKTIIGRGKFATVYPLETDIKTEDVQTVIKIALARVPAKEFEQRFQRETEAAVLAGELQLGPRTYEPNCWTCPSELDNRLLSFLEMDYAAIDGALVTGVMLQTCLDRLFQFHARGWIHGDINDENVVIVTSARSEESKEVEYRLLLLDYGQSLSRKEQLVSKKPPRTVQDMLSEAKMPTLYPTWPDSLLHHKFTTEDEENDIRCLFKCILPRLSLWESTRIIDLLRRRETFELGKRSFVYDVSSQTFTLANATDQEARMLKRLFSLV